MPLNNYLKNVLPCMHISSSLTHIQTIETGSWTTQPFFYMFTQQFDDKRKWSLLADIFLKEERIEMQ